MKKLDPRDCGLGQDDVGLGARLQVLTIQDTLEDQKLRTRVK